jgi:hypothetical protein
MKWTADFQQSRTGSDSCRLDTFAEENDVDYRFWAVKPLRSGSGNKARFFVEAAAKSRALAGSEDRKGLL